MEDIWECWEGLQFAGRLTFTVVCSVVPIRTSPVKSSGQKVPKNSPVVQKKQESSSDDSSSEEDQPKAKAVSKPPPPKTPVKTPAKPAAVTKKQESSSDDSDDSKYSSLAFQLSHPALPALRCVTVEWRHLTVSSCDQIQARTDSYMQLLCNVPHQWSHYRHY
jgi:hypothetical protein